MPGPGAAARWGEIRRRVPYGWRDGLALARTPIGRHKLRSVLWWLAWPLLRLAAWTARRTALRRRQVIAVTGSSGKTTTVRAIAAALGVPPPIDSNFRSHLAMGLLRRGFDRRPLVLEVGISRPRQMVAYGRMLRPDLAVVTSLGSDHQRAMGGRAALAQQKGDLVAAVEPGGLVVLNGDQPEVLALAGRRRAGARLVTAGLGPGNDYRALDLALDWPAGTSFRLAGPRFEGPARVRLLGGHQVRAAVIAAAIALEQGEAPEGVLARLAALAPTPGRLEPAPLASGAWLLCDDRKSHVESMAAALDFLPLVPARRRVAVIGDLTEVDDAGDPAYGSLGASLARHADRVLHVGEAFAAMLEGAPGPARAKFSEHRTVLDAATALGREIGAGDVVLIKGRRDQRLTRVVLRLLGREVGCELRRCAASMTVGCGECPMLARGWAGLRPVT